CPVVAGDSEGTRGRQSRRLQQSAQADGAGIAHFPRHLQEVAADVWLLSQRNHRGWWPDGIRLIALPSVAIRRGGCSLQTIVEWDDFRHQPHLRLSGNEVREAVHLPLRPERAI